ncbi:helix-turn-helix transcriptional regulator [Euzebya tangerina]|uniref:helix-turn-helix transcriptional regulator n=1 Tax=Euzebya tangerina TaxID=591198 RepID=UPI000E3100DE|nr:WYL domain-containing protein [Euzebya tangerina]
MNATLVRLRRVLVMVPWLLEHPGVSVEEVARRFEVTPNEVLDDLDVLGYCGLPGYGGGDLIEASVSGGQVVVRMAEFFSRPLAISMREGLSLLLAARAARDSGVLADFEALSTAIEKLETHLGAEAAVPVAMDLRTEGEDHLAQLWPLVSDPRVVNLRYWSPTRDEVTDRAVEPWTVRSVGGAWYLQGFCRRAQHQRSFRLDRIQALEVTSERAPAPPDHVPPPLYRPSDDDPQVVIDVQPHAAWVGDHVVLDDREVTDDGWTRLSFRTAGLDWAVSLLMRLGRSARVVRPPALVDRWLEQAGAIRDAYP